MDDDKNSNDKVIFIIGFLALIFALPNYKDYLEPIKISFFSHTTSLYILFILMGCILFLSVYLYAIDNLKYCSLSLVKISQFFHISLIADLLYAIAVLVFPIVILLLYISSTSVAYIKGKYFDVDLIIGIVNVIVLLFSTVLSLFSYWSALKAKSEKLQYEIETARESESTSLLKAEEVYKKGYYDYMLIELNNAIEQALYAKLTRIHLIENNRYLPISRLIKFAEHEKLIDTTQKLLIEEIRTLRNQVAHGKYSIKLDEEKAKQLLDGAINLTFQLSNTE